MRSVRKFFCPCKRTSVLLEQGYYFAAKAIFLSILKGILNFFASVLYGSARNVRFIGTVPQMRKTEGGKHLPPCLGSTLRFFFFPPPPGSRRTSAHTSEVSIRSFRHRKEPKAAASRKSGARLLLGLKRMPRGKPLPAALGRVECSPAVEVRAKFIIRLLAVPSKASILCRLGERSPFFFSLYARPQSLSVLCNVFQPQFPRGERFASYPFLHARFHNLAFP